MLLRKMTPLAGFGQLRRDLDCLFGDFLTDTEGPFSRQRAFPALNIWEDGDRFFVEADVPGLTMDDVHVEVLGNELTLKGQRTASDDENRTFRRRERGVGKFSRVISLPVDIDANNVEAVLKNGVLTVTLPKSEASKMKTIEVKALD